MNAARRLDRVAFTTSRLAEFVGVKELVAQTGQTPTAWPLLILKELADNAIDACEEAVIAPELSVKVDTDDGLITIADNGPGIPAETIAGMLDYSVRVSSREAYVSPTRGAQGNALKTIVAMGFALDGERGLTEIESQGKHHRITFEVDAVRRVPKIIHEVDDGSSVKTGAVLRVHWPNSARSELVDARSRFLQMAGELVWLNPHLSLSCKWDDVSYPGEATDPSWGERKWRPSDPTSAHWYNADTFSRYMAAHIARDQDNGVTRPLREFVAELRGLSGSAKQKLVLDEVGASRASLAAFFAEGKNEIGVAALLAACQEHSRPVKPEILGFIGEDNLRANLVHIGALEATIKYQKRALLDSEGTPWLIEAAFGWRGPEADESRIIVTGINWSPAIGDPFPGIGPYGQSLSSILAEQRAQYDEPIVFFLHVTTPRPRFVDRGKSAVRLESVSDEVENCVRAVTKAWAQQRKREERDHNAALRRLDRLVSTTKESTIKDAAESVMEEAYLKASGDGQYPVKARQIMYAARPAILALTNEATLDDRYFTQTLLPDYLNDHPEDAAQWDVVWDARGTFREPHTFRSVPIGTLEVRSYLNGRPNRPSLAGAPLTFSRSGYPTIGPERRYKNVLFIEKEGFDPLMDRSQLAERFDAATMSTKGMSTTAARFLLDKLSARGVEKILVLHDFDVSGFSIFGTLGTDNRRYRFVNDIPIFDIGLRLDDVERLGLESEPVVVKGKWSKRAATLRRCGATEAEIDFLRDRRVELNAMTSPQMIAFIEEKFEEHGITKLVPEDSAIEEHGRHLMKLDITEKLIAKNWKKIIADTKSAQLPTDLRKQVAAMLEDYPVMSWDDAVARIVKEKKR